MKFHELKPFAVGLMAAAMMFASCGSDNEGNPSPTPPPVDEDKVVPTLAVSIPEHMRSGDFDQELTHVYLYADSARLEFNWVLEEETNYYEVGDELSLTIGDQEYILTEIDGKFTTDLLRAEFNDQYLEDIAASASVEITDASYEEEGDAVVPFDFTITTGRFGSVSFEEAGFCLYRSVARSSILFFPVIPFTSSLVKLSPVPTGLNIMVVSLLYAVSTNLSITESDPILVILIAPLFLSSSKAMSISPPNIIFPLPPATPA